MDLNNYRTFKDFLTFYNLMSETCFTNCVDNFNTRSLDINEEQCIERCMGKYINFNHRILAIYAQAQQQIVKKRTEELAKQTVPEVNSDIDKDLSGGNVLESTNNNKE